MVPLHVGFENIVFLFVLKFDTTDVKVDTLHAIDGDT